MLLRWEWEPVWDVSPRGGSADEINLKIYERRFLE